MQLQARRVFRLSAVLAVSLALAYAMAVPLPYIAPVFAFMLTATPGPPLGPKALFGLVLLLLLTTGVGLLLIPFLVHYPVTGVLLAALGIYLSFYLTVHLGKGLVGALLAVGVALISAAGLVSYALATTVIQSLVIGMIIAVASQWVVYPWFPENPGPAQRPPPKPGAEDSKWIALRGTLILLPVYLVALSNPAMYLATIMKTVSLSQQSSLIDARSAGRELIGSTFLAGCFAILAWVLLGICPNLWMFFWLTLLGGIYFAAKLYRLIPSRFPGSFWLNVAVTMLILLGPAVEDSANGKDVYTAFAVRMGLFVAVTLYAWLAVYTLEWLRERRRHKRRRSPPPAAPMAAG
jgi:hypothetical protein